MPCLNSVFVSDKECVEDVRAMEIEEYLFQKEETRMEVLNSSH